MSFVVLAGGGGGGKGHAGTDCGGGGGGAGGISTSAGPSGGGATAGTGTYCYSNNLANFCWSWRKRKQ